MASAIHEKYGINENNLIMQIFKNFDFVVELMQDSEDHSQKYLKGISEFFYDEKTDKVKVTRVCVFDANQKKWLWNSDMDDKSGKILGMEKEYFEIKGILSNLESVNRMPDARRMVFPAYYKSAQGSR